MPRMTALSAFKRAFQDAAHPFVVWMTTEGPDAVGLHNPWPELVADMEAEGAALIGAKPCKNRHGIENPSLTGDPDNPLIVIPGPCYDCGAAL